MNHFVLAILLGIGFTIWTGFFIIFFTSAVGSYGKTLIKHYFQQKEEYHIRLASIPGTDEFNIKNVH